MINAGRVLIIPRGDYDPAYTYEMLDLVSFNGSSYIAKGSTTNNPPTNTAYWQVIALGGDTSKAIANFAYVETTAIATREYQVGEYLIDLNEYLKKVTAHIDIGDNIIDGTNVTTTTVAEAIGDIKQLLEDTVAVMAMLKPAIRLTAQTDLNTLTDIGEYGKSAADFFVTNAPLGIDSVPSATFRLRVEKGSDGNNKILQTLRTDKNKTYTRAYQNSGWTEWITDETKLTFDGLTAEWNALTPEEMALYRYVILTDD